MKALDALNFIPRVVVVAHIDAADLPECWIIDGDEPRFEVIDLDGVATSLFSNGFLVEDFVMKEIDRRELENCCGPNIKELWVGFD